MASENFLVNPPRHMPKSKSKAKKAKHTKWSFPSSSLLGKEGTLHRPRVYTMGGHWQTSLDSRVAKPGMRLNPIRKNPGEELMFIGANPFREVKHMKHKKHHTKKHSYKHSPAKSHKKHGKKHYRHNPVLDGSMVKPVVAALAGGLATMIVPNLLSRFVYSGANQGIMGYLVKAGILVGGAYGVNHFMDKNAAIGFASGAGVVIGTEAAVEYMPSIFGAGSPASVSSAPLLTAPRAAATVAGFERLNGFESHSSMGAIDDDGLYGNPLA
jgi:hypothetical protein